ncbi:hypothetical protein D0T49_04790 [Paludibacter sp. 221]|uniref:hypothetical protein n=1 Tax=Paludibacter sp. 221 TaxID=2302939 RepID=UPI0013D82140|nr:hypothetical protein [Paludibacter sp. 221]NDV46355.1 hypothetical protein [Paludibacter sp. 221]
MKRLLFLFSLIACTVHTQAQGLDYSHNLIFWGNTGYSSIMALQPETSSSGKVGANIGFGYEYRYKRFMLQTGFEVQHLSSVMKYDEFTHTVPMRDTEGRDFEGIFIFRENREQQYFNNVSVPLLVGFSHYDIYFLIGGKFQFNFSNKMRTVSTVTSKARYDMLVGSDGQGLLEDMPNHGLTDTKRTVEGGIKISPIYVASFEVGKNYKPAMKKSSGNARYEYLRRQREFENRFTPHIFDRHYYRIAFFCDYGFTSLKEKNPPGIIINTATQPKAYAPALNHMLYGTDKTHTLHVGVKLTLLFQFKGEYPCHCY